MPLIYSGQEYGMNHRLKFFEKDTIPKTKGETWKTLEKLGALKNNRKALHGAKNGASYKRLSTSNDEYILAFQREKNGDTFIFVANFSDKKQEFKISVSGDFVNYESLEEVSLKTEEIHNFEAWEHKILLSN
jgi:glycosidase